jgi:clan AA aspartic protease
MITGTVNAHLEATIRLAVREANGDEHEIEAIIGTGFSASLTLPPSLVRRFGLPWRTRDYVTLANGAQEMCDVHAATVIWDGRPRRILVDVADTTPLVGMGLLSGYRVTIDVVAGGRVIIQRSR